MSSKYSHGNANPDAPFAIRLSELLDNNKMTATQLAKKIGKTPQAISQYKNGVNDPTIDALEKIADYFNTSTDYLLGRTDDPNIQHSVIDETGLTDSAVQTLKHINALQDAGYPFLFIVNSVLSHPEIDDILHSIELYYATIQAREISNHLYSSIFTDDVGLDHSYLFRKLDPSYVPNDNAEAKHDQEAEATYQAITNLIFSNKYNKCIRKALMDLSDFSDPHKAKLDSIRSLEAIQSLKKLHEKLLDEHIKKIKSQLPSLNEI